jgi:hypothetical protein
VELPLVELELELELLDPVPPSEIPVVPELLLDELELLDELDEEVEELLEVEVLVLVELCPELPAPVEPPANMATAIPNSEGRLAPSTRPGTSRGSSSLDNTNSLLPL